MSLSVALSPLGMFDVSVVRSNHCDLVYASGIPKEAVYEKYISS